MSAFSEMHHLLEQVEVGEVVRWKSGDRRYTYAALKTPDRWYTTSSSAGEVYVPKLTSTTNLAEILTRLEVHDVELAIVWTPLEPEPDFDLI